MTQPIIKLVNNVAAVIKSSSDSPDLRGGTVCGASDVDVGALMIRVRVSVVRPLLTTRTPLTLVAVCAVLAWWRHHSGTLVGHRVLGHGAVRRSSLTLLPYKQHFCIDEMLNTGLGVTCF